MISLEKIRQIDPETKHLTDEELEKVRDSFYEFGQLVFEDWCAQKFGPKSPIGLLTRKDE